MENQKLYVGVHCEFVEQKIQFKIDTTKGMTLGDLQSVLVGALNLSIRGEKTPELQGKRLREIISFMESELIDVDSFKDAYIGIPKQDPH